MKEIDLNRFVSELMAESDPEKRVAMTRKLRAGVWDVLGEDALEKIRKTGLDVDGLRGPVRLIK